MSRRTRSAGGSPDQAPPPEGAQRPQVPVHPRRRSTDSLRQVEEHLEKLISSVRDYAIFLLDQEGHVLTWNAGAEAIKGYRADEILGEHFSRFYPPEALATRWPEQELAEAGRVGSFEDEGWRLRKDGSRFWASVVITALRDEEGGVRGFLKITRDLTDRRHAEEALRVSEEALRRSHDDLEVRVRERTAELARVDANRNRFLAMLGHELRNPLAPIRNALEILKSGPEEAPRERALSLIERQVEHVVRLVDDLLDVSRVIHGKIELRRRIVDLATAVERGVENAQPVLDAHGHRLQVTQPAEPLWVHGDVVRLAQVVSNLLGNAAKYTPEPSRIELSTRREGGEAVLAVRDPGIGIPPELLPSIFDFFVQGESSLARSAGGLGIGLTLVHHIVALHGGTVAASSPGEGRGAVLSVRLPLAGADRTPEIETAMAASNERRRVLVVDDNVDAAESLVELLTIWGHEATSSHDGPSALAAVAKLRPEVVLLDIGLPGMNGYEVASQLRAIPDNPVLLLAALTGYGQPGDRERSAAAGFHVHLTKPVDAARLRELLSELPPR
jgi:PAS domain S-box-containing protein